MKYNKLLSEDGIYASKASLGLWISLLILIALTVVFMADKINISAYDTSCSVWTNLLLIFIGYKGILKGIDRYKNNGSIKNDTTKNSGDE